MNEQNDRIVQCCDCGRIRMGLSWLAPDYATLNNVVFTHGYCPECLHVALKKIEEHYSLNFATEKVASACSLNVA